MWWNLPPKNQLWAISTSHPVPKIEMLFALICLLIQPRWGLVISFNLKDLHTNLLSLSALSSIVPMVEATRSYPDSSNCEAREEEFPGSFGKQLYFLPGILPTKGGGCSRRWPIWLSFPGTFPVLALRFPKKNPSVLGKLPHPTTFWSYTNKKIPFHHFPGVLTSWGCCD